MAIYHLSAKTVARASGRSAVAAAAYRAGTRLVNERDGLAHDFRARSGIVSTFIVAPDSAPAWALDRQALWSAAEMRETRLNAVTAREWEAALPAELDADQREALARAFAVAMVERFGLVADCALHAPSGEGDDRNHHLHMLTTTRAMDADGLGAKTRALDDRKSGAVEGVRELWETLANEALERARVEVKIDRRSLKAQAAEAVGAAQEAAEAQRRAEKALNPLGRRQRVAEATERATEATERAEALSRPPTTHQGPQRPALARAEARFEARAGRLIDAIVRAANAAVPERTRRQVYERATQHAERFLTTAPKAWVAGIGIALAKPMNEFLRRFGLPAFPDRAALVAALEEDPGAHRAAGALIGLAAAELGVEPMPAPEPARLPQRAAPSRQQIEDERRAERERQEAMEARQRAAEAHREAEKKAEQEAALNRIYDEQRRQREQAEREREAAPRPPRGPAPGM